MCPILCLILNILMGKSMIFGAVCRRLPISFFSRSKHFWGPRFLPNLIVAILYFYLLIQAILPQAISNLRPFGQRTPSLASDPKYLFLWSYSLNLNRSWCAWSTRDSRVCDWLAKLSIKAIAPNKKWFISRIVRQTGYSFTSNTRW